MLLKILPLLVICLAVTKACDLDFFLEAFHDDFGSDEDEGATQKPPTQAGASSGPAPAPAPTAPSRPQVTSVNSNSPAVTSFNATSEAAVNSSRRINRMRFIGKILDESPSFRELRESKLRAITVDSHDDESEQGRSANEDFGDDRHKLFRSAVKDKILDLLEVGDSDDVEVEEIGRSHNEDTLLRILLKHLDHASEKEHEHKHAHIAKQKRKHMRKEKKKMLKLLLLMLDHSYKHSKDRGYPHVSQKVMIQFPEVKHVHQEEVKPKDEEQIKCKFDENNYVTCIKDRKVYETIKLNPKEHSEIHKIEENVRYSMVKDDKALKDEVKESMDRQFKTQRPRTQSHMGYDHDHEPYPYHNSRPHYNSQMDKDDYVMEQERYHHSPDYLSSRFNPDDKESSGGKSNGTAEAEPSSNATVAATIAP